MKHLKYFCLFFFFSKTTDKPVKAVKILEPSIIKTKVNRTETEKNDVEHYHENGEDDDEPIEDYFEYDDYYETDDKSVNQSTLSVVTKEPNKDYKLIPIKGNDKVCTKEEYVNCPVF